MTLPGSRTGHLIFLEWGNELTNMAANPIEADSADLAGLLCGCAVLLGSSQFLWGNSCGQEERTSSSLSSSWQMPEPEEWSRENWFLNKHTNRKTNKMKPFWLCSFFLVLKVKRGPGGKRSFYRRRETLNSYGCLTFRKSISMLRQTDLWTLPARDCCSLINSLCLCYRWERFWVPPPPMPPSGAARFPPATLRRSGKLELPSGVRDVRLRM